MYLAQIIILITTLIIINNINAIYIYITLLEQQNLFLSYPDTIYK